MAKKKSIFPGWRKKAQGLEAIVTGTVKSHTRVTGKKEERPVSVFAEIRVHPVAYFSLTSPECRIVLEREGHMDPNPHLSPSRFPGPQAFGAEDDGCMAETGISPMHAYAGDDLARKRYTPGGCTSLGQHWSVIHAGLLSLRDGLALQSDSSG